MDVIETAIRNAFAKGDASDRAFREKVYRSAFAALERALKANPNVTVETAINRRKNLQGKIAEIESEFIPAVPAAPELRAAERALDEVRIEPETPRPAAPAAPEVSLSQPGSAPAAGQAAPSVAPDRGEGRPQPGGVLPEPPQFDPRAERAAPAAPSAEAVVPAQVDRVVDGRRRRPFAAMFVIVTLAAAIGAGIWWGMSTGLFKSLAELDTSVPNPPKVAAEEDFDPDEEPIGAPALPGTADQRDWISIFAPADASTVAAPGGTEAKAMTDDTGAFLRIRSTSDAAIVFDVGQGILEQLAGKRVVFAVVARAEEGKETQISIACNFGELGGCGRKRYAVGYERGDFLFEVEFPAKKPGAAGTIAIVSDLGGEGKAVDVYEIKASAAE